MNFKTNTPKRLIEDSLFSYTFATLFEQTKAESKETLEFKLTRHLDILSFDISLSLEAENGW